METISIGLACTLLGAIISYLSFQRNKNKDIRAETREDAETKAKLDYISRGVDDIKLDNKQRDREMSKMNDRLIRVEESCKSAHKRIDNFEEEK
ncbi:hypothetical protein JCM1393_25540 [Clostridium carnis]